MEKSYSNISENLKRLRFEIGESIQKYGRGNGGVKLMAVTKTIPVEAVNEAVRLGVDLLGENKAQELLLKYDGYDKNVVKIHFIGHLQSNKVRQIIGKVSMIESVDSVSLAREIDKQSHKNGIKTDVLVEVNIGGEASKFGVFPQRLEELLAELSNFPHITVKGLMAIPPFSDDVLQTEKYFSAMHELFVDIRGKNIDNVSMDVLSMGMSGDFKEAIKHGSNIIRIGTALFGARDYS